VTNWYSIDEDKKLVYVTVPEKTDLAESLQTLRQLAADERLGEGFGILMDARHTYSIPTAEEARAIASEMSSLSLFLRHPTALVVSQVVQYGLGSMISIIAGFKGATIQVFYEAEEAEAWLQAGHERGHKN
jgi:hypothetical protein